MLAQRRLPLFTYDGEIGPAAWWQRREMVVALLDADCPACARLRHRLAARSADLRSREAGEVALELDGRGAGLAAEAARSLGLEPAASVIVADRYGEVFAVVPVHGAEPDAVIDEVESWIDHIQQQCPE